MASALDKQPKIGRDGKYNKRTYKIISTNITVSSLPASPVETVQMNSKRCIEEKQHTRAHKDVKFQVSLGEEIHYFRPLFQRSSRLLVTVGCAVYVPS